jgi:hypothetical protein
VGGSLVSTHKIKPEQREEVSKSVTKLVLDKFDRTIKLGMDSTD